MISDEQLEQIISEVVEEVLEERCQKGYKTHPKRKTKIMFGRRYRNCVKAEQKDGEEFHGVSIINEKGKRKITDHIVVDVVTFSFFLFFNFRVNKPPMQ